MHLEALTNEGRELFPALAKFDNFYLAGGTALALQIGHRQSIDFDLFSVAEIAPNLLEKVERVFPNQTILPVVNNRQELTVLVNGVKITFLSYPFPPVTPLGTTDKLPLAAIKDIAAMKAYAVGRRGTYKDYVDLYFILIENYASLEEIVSLTQKKFGPEFNDRLFLEQLVYLEDINEDKLLFLKQPVSKHEIEEFFLAQVKAFKL